MTSPHASQQARPWWADVAHLRDETTGRVRTTEPPTTGPALATAESRVHSRERHPRPGADAQRRRSNGQRRPARAASGSARPDWFAQEAATDGRVARREAPSRPDRPRAQLVDVAPDHAILSRPLQVRRKPGERPTVTITGRPEAALPPRPAEPRELRARRTRETLTALVSSPDRLILWAVALGILMILASLGTANAGV